MSFVQRELNKISSALLQEADEGRKNELYVAQQALFWVLDPSSYRTPFNMIMDIQAEPKDCSAHNHQPPS